ncbi:MAG: Hsp33 family molecular chaperone HslO, partial [Kiritimatiellae bacterium]|nr:Hsp33 family molecular chaperone HslO [Kiritimatiellia bacterium]
MENERLEFFDEATRISVVLADVRNAAQTLANAHLNGPVSAQRLAEALAGVALLGAEMAQDGETVSWKGDFGTAPLGGFLVEATAAGTLRGYTQKKILDDFDGVKSPSDIELLGSKCRFETVRSIPGKILASGAVEVPAAKTGTLAAGLDALFAQSLQRKAKSALFASVDDSLHVIAARGAMAELLPDGD